MGCGSSKAKIPTMINDDREKSVTISKRAPTTKFSHQNDYQINELDKFKYYFESLGVECEDVQDMYQLYNKISEPRNVESILQYFDESHNRFFAKFLGQIHTSTIDFKDFVILMYYYVSISNYYGKYFIL
jgi:hypothetical protein